MRRHSVAGLQAPKRLIKKAAARFFEDLTSGGVPLRPLLIRSVDSAGVPIGVPRANGLEGWSGTLLFLRVGVGAFHSSGDCGKPVLIVP